MKRKLMFLLACLFVGIGLATAQTQSVSGIVTSEEDGEPIVGASVLVKGTNQGGITDINGRFNLSNVPSTAKTLQVSYIGMKTKDVNIGPNLSIVLSPDTEVLDEVLVTAVGVKRSEKSLGYAATSVKSKDIMATGDRSALNALQGKVAGVEITSASGAPGSSTRVILRGFTSLSGSNQPLYVIDGVPMDNSVINNVSLNGGMDFGNRANDLNPNDIESMTILKGGSGTALYGSRAANGVILITTKNGAQSKGKAKVEVTSTTTFDNPLKLPKMQNEFGQGWYNRSTAEGADLAENGSWGPKFDGVTRPWGFVVDGQQQIKPYSALPTNIKDFFDTGVTLNNAISISNGDDNKSFYISYANVFSDGIMPTDADSYERHTVSARGSSKFLDIFTVSASMNYVRKDSKYTATGQDQSALDGLWQNPRDISIVDGKDYMGKFNNPDNYYTLYAQNPYFILNEHGTKFSEDRVYGNIGLDVQILPWLVASGRVGADVSNSNLKNWRAIYESARADYNNEPGRVSLSSYSAAELNTDFTLKANYTWGDFTVDGLVGHNYNQRTYGQESAGVIGLDIPYFYNLSNSSATPSVYEYTSKRRLVGVYGNVNVGWKNMLYLGVSARNDWSSTLPKATRSFFYPSFSTSFIFTELLPKSNILSFGKLRFGIAQTGNDANPYLLDTVMLKAENTDGYVSLTYPLAGNINAFTVSNRIGNQNLKPELSTDVEVGLDLRFFDSRLNFDLAYYNKTVTNLIWAANISAGSGYTTQTMNLGKITNKGIELAVNAIPIRTKDLTLEVFLNYSRNANKLVKLTEGLDQISLGGTSSIGFMARPGQPLGLFEVTVPATTDSGQIIVDEDGLPKMADSKVSAGSSQNKYRLGGGLALTYKNWNLRATFDYRNGGKMYSRTAEMMYFTGNAEQTTYNDRQPWIIPNSVQEMKDAEGNAYYVENTTPVSGYDHNLNSFYNQTYNAGIGGAYALVSKTFFKLRELTVTYTVPKKWLNKTKVINSASVAFVGRNLFIWTPNSNMFTDPESTTFGNDLEANYGEYGATPTTRSLGFSVNIGF